MTFPAFVRAALFAGFVLAVSCGASTSQTPPAAASSVSTAPTGASSAPLGASMRAEIENVMVAPAPEPRADGRLPDLARPLGYTLHLDVDPNAERYTGTVRIDLDVRVETPVIVLHGRGLTVSSVGATLADGTTVGGSAAFRSAANGRGEPEELVLQFNRALPAGHVSVSLVFAREYEEGLRALYRVHSRGDWYAFTQFEPNDARRAFPCFDEPGFKVPWDVSLTVPQNLVAVANMPEASRATEGNRVTVHFARTPPMSSYLVAFAVGPFDVVEGARTPVPIRAITAHGQGALAHAMLEAAADHVRILGEYFGRAYPYPKLDLVAVPEFGAGAMENAGLITFREELMLLDGARAPTSARRAMASVLAHELAHQWFGDLVTMQWWNDLWLNEGFATWMQAHVVDQWHPTFGAQIEAVRERAGAMEIDSLPAARAVRQPVNSTSDALEAFDGITYVKGAAVLRMLEAWLGADAFRRGVQAYLHEHEWGNASADDLLTALDHVAPSSAPGHDVRAIANSFLDHAGVPLVSMELQCAAGAPPTLALSQRPYRVASAVEAPSAMPNQLWQIPVCVTYDGARHDAVTCTVLSDATGSLVLQGATRCPRWVVPNVHEAGYFRYRITPAIQALAAPAVLRTLEVRTRAGLVEDAWAMVRGGELDAGAFLRLLDGFRGEQERLVVDNVLSAINGVWDGAAAPDTRPAIAQWVRAFLGPLGHRLGWTARPGDSDDRRLLRRSVLSTLGRVGEDPHVLAEAERFARAYFRDAHSVDADVAALAVPMASRRADAAQVDAIVAALAHATTPADRVLLNGALAAPVDPAVLRHALDATLTDAVRVQDMLRVIFGASNDPARRETVIAWVHEHLDAMQRRLPPEAAAHVAGLAGNTCTPEEVQREQAFWADRVGALEGATRALREGVERAQQCIALRGREHDHIAAFFARAGTQRH